MGDLIQNTLTASIDQAITDQVLAEPPRGHLGMSGIGNEDARTIYMSHRWIMPPITDPRVNRIFRLGDAVELELNRFIASVPGVTLHPVDPGTGKQFRFSYLGGHFGGSMDGCIIGVPEAPKTWHVYEAKSVNDSRFKELVKIGVKEWSPEYYGQLQSYMGASKMTRALFVAYNKNTSEIYIERVYPEPMYFEGVLAKAERLLTATEPPASSYPNRQFYKSRFMSEHEQAIYWGDRLPDKPNCRNCRHSMPVFDGAADWYCKHHGRRIGKVATQWAGCDFHTWITALVNAEVISEDASEVRYRTKDRIEFANVPKEAEFTDALDFSSAELIGISRNNYAPEVLDDSIVNSLKANFKGRVQWSPPTTEQGQK